MTSEQKKPKTLLKRSVGNAHTDKEYAFQSGKQWSSRLDDKELSNDIEEAEIKLSSSSRRYDSVGENSSQKWTIAMLCLRYLLRRVFVVINPRQKVKR